VRKATQAKGIDEILEEATGLLFQQERVAEAAKLLGELGGRSLTSDQHSEVLLLRGWIHERRAQLEQGRPCAQAVLSESVDPYWLGKAHYLLGVLAELQSLDPSSPDEPAVVESLAQYRQAIDLLEDDPDQLEVIDAMAHLLLDVVRPDEAIALLEGAASHIWPTTELLGTAYARLGDAYVIARHDYGQGRQWLEKAVAILDPIAGWHSWVHGRLAQCCNMQRDYAQAAQHAKRALELAARHKGGESYDLMLAHKEHGSVDERHRG
jgi:tetratricopeptide (TPR) repeat protein